MNTRDARSLRWLPLLLSTALMSNPAAAATRSVDEHQSADPNGTVEIINVAGSVIVSGWERNEVAVSGRIGDKVQGVELSGSGAHLTVRVVLPEGTHWGGDGAARLTINVPQGSALNASLVSSDLTVTGVSGAQQLRTVSGDITSQGMGAARINTVSGDVRLSVPKGTRAEVQSVSGEMTVDGAGDEVAVSSVSGDGHLTLGALSHFHLSTVSGDFVITGALSSGADFEAESLSGDMHVTFSGQPAAQFDLQTLSGDIANCSAPQATKAHYGPGTRLNFSSGDGSAQVHLSSKSGDLSLCAR